LGIRRIDIAIMVIRVTDMAMAIIRMDTTDRIDIMVIPQGPPTTATGIGLTATMGIITTIAIKLA